MLSLLLYVAWAAIPTASIPLAPRATEQSISWSKCLASWRVPADFVCANLTVPVNWDEPDGETITLGITKWPRASNSSAEKIGNLFINPGGPGGSAIRNLQLMEVYSQGYIADIRERFDLIGVDPRGVGRSAQSNCSSSIYNERVSLFPKTEEEYNRLVDKNRRLGESCRSRTGKVIDYLDTISAAKDHEAVRAALGGKMNWLGLSYGTQLGAQYAQLFPQHVRAMALDAVLQHSQAESSNILIESTTFNAELKSFFSWAQRSNYSSLQGKDVEKMWTTLINASTTAPIPAPGCDNLSCRTDVNAEEILFNAQNYVDDWVGFADALSQASAGNATLLSSSLAQDPFLGVYAGTTIGCQDWAPAASSFADMQAKMRIGEIFTPLTRGACEAWSLQASCIGWPAPARNPPAKLNVQTENTILITTTMQDPNTSYTWAVGMLQEIQNHFFLVRSGGGHGSYTRGGATTAATNHYLITLELPAVGTVLDS